MNEEIEAQMQSLREEMNVLYMEIQQCEREMEILEGQLADELEIEMWEESA